jgi:hypothetical protein
VLHAFALGQAAGDAQRIVAADGDDGIKLQPVHVLQQVGQVLRVLLVVGIGARSVQNRATVLDDGTHSVHSERLTKRLIADQTFPAVLQTDHFNAVIGARARRL